MPEDCYKECDNGYYSTNGLEPCSMCPNGTYSAQKGSLVCQNCTQNNVSIAGYCKLPKSNSWVTYKHQTLLMFIITVYV